MKKIYVLMLLVVSAVALGQAAPSSAVDFSTITAHILPNTSATYNLGSVAKSWSIVYSNNILLTGAIQDGAGVTRIQANNGARTFYNSDEPNGATAIGHRFSTIATLSTVGAKVMSFENALATKWWVDKDGTTWTASTTLRTCALALEGVISLDAAAGGTSGHRTRRCMCTSDGAGSPAYAWQNIVTGTLGDTTTCAD